MEIALQNEEEKSKLQALKKKILETKLKNEEEKLAINRYKALLAERQYEDFINNGINENSYQ